MINLKKIIFCFIISLIIIPVAKAENKVNIHLFYSELCSTCQAEKEYLSTILDDNVNIITYEVTRNASNEQLFMEVYDALKVKGNIETPFTVIGTTPIKGFNKTVENQIQAAIEKYKNNDYVDIVDVIFNDLDVDYQIDTPEGLYNIPLLGNIDPKEVSLPLISIIVGFIDGFNPCAMWVLLFLLSMIMGMKNRRKMWTIGLTFLITSALVYLCFMLAWLQVAITLTQISWIRLIIALIALIGGIINLTSYAKERKKDNGCEIVDNKKRKSIYSRMKKIISKVDDDEKSFWKSEKSFIIALLGIIGLAFSVNLVELACSSGLPLIFTQILAINDLSTIQYVLYILLYIVFFLIDDMVIFVIAMKTFKLTGISTKYNKLSHLIGGIIMVLIGILMIFKPEWLMFNF